MKILLIGKVLDTVIMQKTAKKFNAKVVVASSKTIDITKQLPADFDVAIISRDHGDHAMLDMPQILEIPVLVSACAESQMQNHYNISFEDNLKVNQYLTYGGKENIENLFKFLEYLRFNTPIPNEPIEIPLDAIYSQGEIYRNTKEYFNHTKETYDSYVGLINYRSRWIGDDQMVEDELIKKLNNEGIGVISVFSVGATSAVSEGMTLDKIIDNFFCIDGEIKITGLINMLGYNGSGADVGTLFERVSALYQRYNLIAFHPIQSYYLTPSAWERSASPFNQDAVLHFDYPEMQGMIEPVLIGLNEETVGRIAIDERISHFVSRLKAWLNLRIKNNADKHVAIMMNNAVCSSVEATLGRAHGLDSFASVLALLNKLKSEGYDVQNIPQDKDELRNLFFQKRAYSDFRWTSVEEIRENGGALYQMDKPTYLKWYNNLSSNLQKDIEAEWGEPIGESMTLDDKILITGLKFGNVEIFIEPKRGCYGAKCTGEVCKVLQNPISPPTHQYMATYHYIKNCFKADALVHMGTHGSLEYLPGKTNGLSGECFPDLLLGHLPYLYLTNAGSMTSGKLAKRRTYAVTITHKSLDDALHTLDNIELNALICGLNGGFIEPGQSGTYLDGDFPTGRNMYFVQADKLPTKQAYARGVEAANALIDSYLSEEGKYPNQIALSMTAMDIPRTDGEQVSQMLALMGTRPIWDEVGRVTGIEVIPQEELNYPRIDVCVQISSVLRDTWTNVIAYMDDAVLMVAGLDEKPEENYIIKNIQNNKSENADLSRIFGAAPGSFSGSVNLVLKASAWKDKTDIVKYFIKSSAYAYGKDKHGEYKVDEYLQNISRVDVTSDLVSSRHTDALKTNYTSNNQGAIDLAVQYLNKGKKIKKYISNSSNAGVKIQTLDTYLQEGLEETVLNEKWRKKRLQEGYDGAADIMKRLQNVFTAQCVGNSFDDASLDEVVKTCLTNPEMQKWFSENNPYAGEEASRRFLELNTRGKWNGSPEVLNELRKSYLKYEGDLEDRILTDGEIQAGGVDIITYESIDTLNNDIKNIETKMDKIKL